MDAESLDIKVSKVVYAAKLLERALHDTGSWTMSWGPFEVPAVRVLDDDGVLFSAVFPEVCHLEEPSPTVLLRCDGDIVSSRDIDFPGDTSFSLLWRIDGEMVEVPA
jgi:hypothetical protein